MKSARLLGAAAAFALLAACSKHKPAKVETPARAAPVAQKQVTQWTEETSTDSMTDVTTHLIGTSDKRTDGNFSIMCDPEQESVLFSSPLFLDSGSQGTIKIRFDSEKAEDEAVFLTKKVALLRSPKKPGSFKSEPIEKFLMELSAHVFLIELRGRPHQRLRARLGSFDGQSADLEFDISGLQPRLAELERKCGVKG
jgi:hypothetical protein